MGVESRVLFLSVVFLVCASSCAGSPGEIDHELSKSSAFMTSRQPIYVTRASGAVERFLANGTSLGSFLADGPLHVSTASRDGSVVALEDSETNLFFRVRGHDGLIAVRHEELLGRVGNVAISPDGSRAAVMRHADFSTPQVRWREDDRVYLVEVKSGEVKEILEQEARGHDVRTGNLHWSEDGKHLYYSAWTQQGDREGVWFVRLNVESRQREELTQQAWDALDSTRTHSWAWRGRPEQCEGVGVLSQDDEGLYLSKDEKAKPRVLVAIKGRKRGFHDHFDTIRAHHFLPGCDELLFVHDFKVYSYKISTDELGLLTQGVETWFFEEEEPHAE